MTKDTDGLGPLGGSGVSFQAYQVIGYLDEFMAGGDVPKPSSEEMIRALDYFAGDEYSEDFLPWPKGKE